MIFGFTTTGDISVMIHSFNNNIVNPSKLVASRLFSGSIEKITDNLYTCELNYLLPLPTWLFALMTIAGFIFSITWLWILGMIIFVLLEGFQTKYFYYFVLKMGLKKTNYKGKIKLLSESEIIRELKIWGLKDECGRTTNK